MHNITIPNNTSNSSSNSNISSGATTPTNITKNGKKKKKKSDPNIVSTSGSQVITTTNTTAAISSSNTTNMKSNPNLHILEDFDNIDDFDDGENNSNSRGNNYENDLNIRQQQQSSNHTEENSNLEENCNENDQNSNNSDSNSNSSSNSKHSSSSRRLSYKEDDLLRKQRLKENFNQLLIEYKHEEEAQLKKYSKMSNNHHHNSVSASNLINNQNLNSTSNRQNITNSQRQTSLENNKSCVKPSGFSQPNQPYQTQPTTQSINSSSAFRPVTSLTNLLGNSAASQHHQVINQQTTQSQYGGSGAVKLSKTQSASQFATTTMTSLSNGANSNNDNSNANMLQKEIENGNLTSSTSSTSSVSSSGSTSGIQQHLSSHHPAAKSLSIMVGQSMEGQTTTTNNIDKTASMRKSPQKTLMKPPLDLADSCSSSNSTTPTNGKANVEIIDLNVQKPPISGSNPPSNSSANRPTHLKTATNSTGSTSVSKPAVSNLSGYLWKMKEQSLQTNNSSHQFDKYWFALNISLNTLVYWHDKYEQDVGKYPLGKYELTKCCQLAANITPVNDQLDFKIVFHLMNANGASSAQFLLLRAGGPESKAAWCDAIKHVIEYGVNNSCTKCKPKLGTIPGSFNSSQSSSLFSTPQTTPTSANGQYTILSGLGTSNGTFHHMIGQQQQQQQQQPPPPTPQTPPLVSNVPTCNNKNNVENNENDFQHKQSAQSAKSVATTNLRKLKVDQHVSSEMLSAGSSNSSSSASSSASSPASPYLSNGLGAANEAGNNNASSYESIGSLRALCERQAVEIGEITDKWKRSEAALADVSARLAQTRQASAEQLLQIRTLNEQLAKYKECIEQQEREIGRFKRSETFCQNVRNNDETDLAGVSASARGWNKEVKQLDARINDVIEKIKDREISTESKSKIFS
jgi:hypothetical protein